MAYGLKYILNQKLKDDSVLYVSIYEDAYTGDTYNYVATNIQLSPISNSDEPEPGIISSQLNVSFIISTQQDYDNFPDLLSYNDNKYYVELSRTPSGGTESVVWRGYMFNDYVNVPFTTGNQQIDIVCIDALSFMKYIYFAYPENINAKTSLLVVLLGGLNALNFPTLGDLYTCCSYYGSLMDDRADGTEYEPFKQSFLYNRDLVGRNYYDLIDEVVKSFNCRLFQSGGDWWVMSANEMAATNIYYTKYDALSNSVIDSGILSNSAYIQPYSNGNLHFIDNSQTKITRKGYPVLKLETTVKASENYLHNSSFKQGTATTATGWLASTSGTSTAVLQRNAANEFDVWKLTAGSGIVNLYAGNAGSTDIYMPFLYNPGFTLSFDAITSVPSLLYVIVSVENYINPRFYLLPDGTWSTTNTFSNNILVDYTQKDQSWQHFSRDIKLGTYVISGTSYNVYGKLAIEFMMFSGSSVAYIRNPQIKQTVSSSTAQSLLVTRKVGTAESIEKDMTSFYGLYKSDLPNIYGGLYYSNGDPITSWYRFGHTGDSFASLPILIARELSNLFNRNYATLEGDLGKAIDSNGVIDLNNTYTIQDSSTNALSYNNKKFIANRITTNFYANEANSLQLLEITDTDNASTEKVEWTVSG